jgi:hypothetical protein
MWKNPMPKLHEVMGEPKERFIVKEEKFPFIAMDC